MKSKLLTILLSSILIISVTMNIYLFWSLNKTKDQLEYFTTQLSEADKQLANLNTQLSNQAALQNQLSELESQLADNTNQINTLKTSLSDSQTQIESLQQQLSENEATISELEQQQQQSQRNNVTTGNTNSTFIVGQQAPGFPPGVIFGGQATVEGDGSLANDGINWQ